MKSVLSLAKVLTLLFWALIIINLVRPFDQPFNSLLQVAGVVLVLLHVVELYGYRKRLAGTAKPGWAWLQTLVFGVFYVYPLAALPAPLRGAGAVTAGGSAASGATASDQSPQQELKQEGGNA